MNTLKNQRGFSLIEILIVLGIAVGIIAMIASRVAGGRDKATAQQNKIAMQQVVDQLEMYNQDCQSYPTSLEGLVKAPASGCENWGPAPYSKEVPKDAWGAPFAYSSDGTSFELTSYGKDKRAGGDGFAKDVPYSNK